MKNLYSRLSMTRILSLLLANVLLLVVLPPAAAQTTRIIFLHHSCGHNLIEQGGVREGVTARGYEFYDHGYNGDGLRLADGSYTGTHFDVPGDNTDPDGMAEIFAQPLHDPPDNTFSHLMQYDVIAFKSCFPTSNISSDEQLETYQSYYLFIRDRVDLHPDKLFVLVTQPPQVPNSSDPQEAARARELADWLQSDAFLAGHPNLVVFDFFDHLAGQDNFLRPEYRVSDDDAHPNEQANREIGPLFVDFIDRAIQEYTPGEPPSSPDGSPVPEQTPAQATAPPAVGASLEGWDVEGAWESSVDESGSSITCRVDTGMTHEGAAALHIQYAIVPHGWGDCGRYFDTSQDWSGGDGLSLWLQSDTTGQMMNLMLFSGPLENATPFETSFTVPAESSGEWVGLFFPWSDFERAGWAEEGGLAELDPARMTGLGFNLWAEASREEGNVWVSDLQVGGGVAQPPVEPGEGQDVVGGEEFEEEEEGGGVCPFSVLVLPLLALVVWRFGSRRVRPF